jgi:hypothetical protein
MVFMQSSYHKFFLSYRSETRYALRQDISSNNPCADRQTPRSHLSRSYLNCKLLMHAYWGPTITPYFPKYLPVIYRGAEAGRSDNQEKPGR